jgi:hypothetical protein
MHEHRTHFAEINLRVEGYTLKDAERILRTAANLLKQVDGLEVSSIFIVREHRVES